jgi:deoxyribodipyrimidine photolyase
MTTTPGRNGFCSAIGIFQGAVLMKRMFAIATLLGVPAVLGESLPAWAQATLTRHASDPRPHVYTLDEFESGRTRDPLWNAAQTQLLSEGRIHN